MKTWLVCYDISDDKKRTRTGKLLEQYGERVQKSVFEINMKNSGQLNVLKQDLRLILQDEDYDEANVRFYTLCKNCRKDSQDLHGNDIGNQPATIII